MASIHTFASKGSKLCVFISYPNEANLIAEAFQDAFVELDRDRVIPFKDSTSIPMGGDIGAYIIEALNKSDWFIAVGTDVTRQNFSWCGVELGVFTENKRVSGILDKCPVVCVFDQVIPELFRQRKQTQMVALRPDQVPDLSSAVIPVEASPIFELLREFAEYYRNFYGIAPTREIFSAHDAWARKSAHTITDNYWQSIQSRVKNIWLPQKRIEVFVDDSNFYESDRKEFPPSSQVEISIPTYPIFSMAAPTDATKRRISWEDFCDKVMKETGGLIITEQINAIAISVLPDKEKALNDETFLAPDGTYYRIILARHLIYGNGKREFVFHFIESLDPNWGGDTETSVLTAGIMLASKYRFLFLEKSSRYSVQSLEAKDEMDRFFELKSIMKDIRRIHSEAASEGLADRTHLIELIGNTQEVSYLFETWWKEVELLENELGTALKDKTRYEWSSIRGALERFRRETEPLNNRFLNLAMKRYTSIIEGGASPKSSRARRKTQSAAPSRPDRQAPDASPS